MYLDHWKLERPPFDAQPDSRFLYSFEQVDATLASISYAACDAGEPVAIHGPAGCGKTLLLRALRRQLPRERFKIAFVPEVTFARVNLLQGVAYHLTHEVAPDAGTAMHTILQVARDCERDGLTLVIMLDDWPVAPGAAALDALRWLLNLGVEGCRQCVLLTSEAAPRVAAWPEWIRQRLLTAARVEPLPTEHVSEYLKHRVRVAARDDAGLPPEGLFDALAVRRIAEWSRGVPRLVNRLAHLALHVAYLDLTKLVHADAVACAIERLGPVDASRKVTPAAPNNAAAEASVR